MVYTMPVRLSSVLRYVVSSIIIVVLFEYLRCYLYIFLVVKGVEEHVFSYVVLVPLVGYYLGSILFTAGVEAVVCFARGSIGGSLRRCLGSILYDVTVVSVVTLPVILYTLSYHSLEIPISAIDVILKYGAFLNIIALPMIFYLNSSIPARYSVNPFSLGGVKQTLACVKKQLPRALLYILLGLFLSALAGNIATTVSKILIGQWNKPLLYIHGERARVSNILRYVNQILPRTATVVGDTVTITVYAYLIARYTAGAWVKMGAKGQGLTGELTGSVATGEQLRALG